MSIICPTVLASTQEEYKEQIKRVSFAPRIQIDFMDGVFTTSKSIDLKDAWWPENLKADLHLMYKNPGEYLDVIKTKKPNLVIIHAEAEIDHLTFAKELHKSGIKAGLCVLPETSIDSVKELLVEYDHLLIFGGKLGYFGGNADLAQASKAKEAKKYNPNIEIGWDGGVNDQNAKQLTDEEVDVLNVGGFIQKAENPHVAYEKLISLVS